MNKDTVHQYVFFLLFFSTSQVKELKTICVLINLILRKKYINENFIHSFFRFICLYFSCSG